MSVTIRARSGQQRYMTRLCTSYGAGVCVCVCLCVCVCVCVCVHVCVHVAPSLSHSRMSPKQEQVMTTHLCCASPSCPERLSSHGGCMCVYVCRNAKLNFPDRYTSQQPAEGQFGTHSAAHTQAHAGTCRLAVFRFSHVEQIVGVSRIPLRRRGSGIQHSEP